MWGGGGERAGEAVRLWWRCCQISVRFVDGSGRRSEIVVMVCRPRD